MATSFQHPVGQQVAVVVLSLTSLGLLVTATGIIEIFDVVGMVALSHVVGSVGDGTRLLAPPVHVDFVYHRLNVFLRLFVPEYILRPVEPPPSASG